MGEPPIFEPHDRLEIRGRGDFWFGAFPFADEPPRDGSTVIGRRVRMNGAEFEIRGIERHMLATPYRYGEPVGLLLEPVGRS
jgi:hypothetical protein